MIKTTPFEMVFIIRDIMTKFEVAIRSILTLSAVILCPIGSIILMLIFTLSGFWEVTIYTSLLVLPLLIPLIWIKKKKPYLIFYFSFLACFIILVITQCGINTYKDHITIDVTPNIDVKEYMPFKRNSKIVKIESETLSFDDVPTINQPIIDGATAAFPVYSAFIHAVYPSTTKLYEDVFQYNNTVGGYGALARKETDIFIGAYPSKEQIEYAEQQGTTFQYTQIGSEAFVFFVHKDNPVDSLTLEQIKGIYSGQITNWSEVGGKNQKIVAFQRNEGSGSQSMLIRLMGDTPIMEPDMQETIGGMGEIIEEVADYENKSTSIGFSFRFYVEGMIKNPDIKVIAIDGIAPTVENIKNNSYPIVAPVYAVTYEGNTKETVQQLIDWILSDEGQYIIEETGYVGVK